MPPAKNTSGKSDDAKKVTDPTPATETTPPQSHDETDVAAALARKTQDGKGTDPVPPSDFQSFETAGVEKTDELLSIEDVTSEVLAGRWGPTDKISGERLSEAGYDVPAVWREFKRRKDAGAPSAF